VKLASTIAFPQLDTFFNWDSRVYREYEVKQAKSSVWGEKGKNDDFYWATNLK